MMTESFVEFMNVVVGHTKKEHLASNASCDYADNDRLQKGKIHVNHDSSFSDSDCFQIYFTGQIIGNNPIPVQSTMSIA